MTSKITIKLLKEYLKMNNVNKYRLDEINKIKDYFNNEVHWEDTAREDTARQAQRT